MTFWRRLLEIGFGEGIVTAQGSFHSLAPGAYLARRRPLFGHLAIRHSRS
jgi:hypothetical protein